MNCSTCSRELKPSDPKCPQCGTHNPHHAQFLWKLIKQQVTDIPPGLKGSPIEQSLTTPDAPAADSIRSLILELIVRRAMDGIDWRTTCRGPMDVNGINPDDVEAEIKKRLANMQGQQDLAAIVEASDDLNPDYESDDQMSNFTEVREIVREQVLAVIVEQALAGREWREACAAVMKLNGITVEEIEAEVAKRR